jgi:hypothetical protein
MKSHQPLDMKKKWNLYSTVWKGQQVNDMHLCHRIVIKCYLLAMLDFTDSVDSNLVLTIYSSNSAFTLIIIWMTEILLILNSIFLFTTSVSRWHFFLNNCCFKIRLIFNRTILHWTTNKQMVQHYLTQQRNNQFQIPNILIPTKVIMENKKNQRKTHPACMHITPSTQKLILRSGAVPFTDCHSWDVSSFKHLIRLSTFLRL